MQNSEYHVGQVLYIIPSDSASIVPVQIMEKRISETINGTAIKHIIKAPKAKAPPMVLETIKGSVFTDLRQVREVMMKNAATAIDGMVKHAAAVAQQVFAPPKQETMQPEPGDFSSLGEADIYVDEAEMQQQQQHSIQVLPPPKVQQPNGHTMIPDVDSDGMTEIMLPNGTRQRVKLNMG